MSRSAAPLLAPCLLLAATVSSPAAAVPIPWKNCGKPGDLLSITQADASVWPPPVPAPASATATFDTAGNLVNLRVFLLHGVAWTFDSGPLPTSTSAGFVSLPPSFPVMVTNPPLPLAAGPYSTTRIFVGHGTAPVTIMDKANLASQLDPPVTTTLSLSFNGTPGFPLAPIAGAYDVRVQMTEASGADVFCMDLGEPLKSGVLVDVQQASNVPLLSRATLTVLALLVAACGLVAVRSATRSSEPC